MEKMERDKMSDSRKVRKQVKDLGMAAFVKLHGFDLYKREGKQFVFVIDPSQDEEFEKTKVDYINGPFHKFDSEIMALKSL